MSIPFGTRPHHLALGLVLGLSVCPGLARAQSDSGEKIYQKTLRGTVWIVARQPDNKLATGTGSLIDPVRRLVVTNAHVVGDSSTVYLLFPLFRKGHVVAERDAYWDLLRQGNSAHGKVIARDTVRDLALVELDKLPPGVQPIRLARDSAGPGQRVHSIGNPGAEGALWEYTSGTVRQVYHKKWGVKDGERVYQFDAQVVITQSPTNRGDSGGPLVNDQGDLVAVTQGYAAGAQLVSLFIDVSEVKALLASKKIVAHLTPPARRDAPAEKDRSDGAPAADKDTKAEKTAATKLNFARVLAADGKVDKAKDRYEEIINDYPNTKAAAEAKLLLERLPSK